MIGKPSNNRLAGGVCMIRLDPSVVLSEMGRRGWSGRDLSREAGVSQPTIAAALRGIPIRGAKARAIHQAFRRCPPELDELMVGLEARP
jgi:transcriptional regulator with XRE-family HTH domain